jgi:hypothetical protein
MNRRIALIILPALVCGIAIGAAVRPADKDESRLIHDVFFTLKDHSKESREAFLASSKKYLTGHEGTVYFVLGTIAEDVVEPVSVRDFDVALHLVFENKEAEARYIKDPRHVEFVKENKETWSKVSVYDTYLVPTK